MEERVTLQRGWKSFGFAGPVGLLLVYWAASVGGGFRIDVFFLSFAALALCWIRTFVIVPYGEHLEARMHAEWERYGGNDWHLLDILAQFDGPELDCFRKDVSLANNDVVREQLTRRKPNWDQEDIRRFLTYFIDDLSEISTVYVDEQGILRKFDA